METFWISSVQRMLQRDLKCRPSFLRMQRTTSTSHNRQSMFCNHCSIYFGMQAIHLYILAYNFIAENFNCMGFKLWYIFSRLFRAESPKQMNTDQVEKQLRDKVTDTCRLINITNFFSYNYGINYCPEKHI